MHADRVAGLHDIVGPGDPVQAVVVVAPVLEVPELVGAVDLGHRGRSCTPAAATGPSTRPAGVPRVRDRRPR